MNATAAPTAYPINGLLERAESILPKNALPERELTAPVIFRSPLNRIPKPIRIFPVVPVFLLSLRIISTMPMISATGASVDGLKI